MSLSRTHKSAPAHENRDWTDLLRRSGEPGVLVVDAEGRVLACSEVAGELLRRSHRALPGLEAGQLPKPIAALVADMLEQEHGSLERAVVLEAEEGAERQVIWVHAFWWSHPGPPGPAVLVTLHDLSSARTLEGKTGRLQKLATVGTLSAGVAHEIKNALVAIKTYVDLLLEKEPQSESAALVRREVGRIDSLTSQLLRFAGPARPCFAPTHVHKLLSEALQLVQHPLRAHRIEEVLLLRAVQDRVNGDPKQLEQAFLNLLLNALEAMPEGGRLVVSTEVVIATEHVSRFEPDRREAQLQVEIKDTGPGIPSEILARLFHPFLTTKPGGTGLGLAITHRIVREHGGRISVETHVGQGTVFRVLLPLLHDGPATAQQPGDA